MKKRYVRRRFLEEMLVRVFNTQIVSGPHIQVGDYPEHFGALIELLAKTHNVTVIDDPPEIADFLLTALLGRARADAAIGDLNEHFTRDCEELGRRRAVWLYWAGTLHSLWPLLRRAIGKALKWGVVIDTVRRHF